MNDLIELTGAEIAAQNMGIEVTLYEWAKKYGKDHSKMLTQFEKDIAKLTPGKRASLHFGEMVISIDIGSEAKRNISTYIMDVKTTVWFAARFDAELRLDIVNFAFAKIEEDYKKLKKREACLKDEIVKRPVAVKLTNSNKKSRLARHKELMDWVQNGWLDHTTNTSVRHIYTITEEGHAVGLVEDQLGSIGFIGDE